MSDSRGQRHEFSQAFQQHNVSAVLLIIAACMTFQDQFFWTEKFFMASSAVCSRRRTASMCTPPAAIIGIRLNAFGLLCASLYSPGLLTTMLQYLADWSFNN
jgi:hypothetical protein